MLNDTTRRYPRTLREAFPREFWTENAIDDPRAIPVGRRPIWFRVLQFLRRVFR